MRPNIVRLLLVLALVGCKAAPPETPKRVNFYSVGLDDKTEKADETLSKYLEQQAGITLEFDPQDEYQALINRVIQGADDGPRFVARMPPYALVAAELQGAQFDVLGTYRSKATDGAFTYHSYFVVDVKKHAGFFSGEPTIDQVQRFLSAGNRKFVYHDKFSASSYFVPSLWFARHNFMETKSKEKEGKVVHLDVASVLERRKLSVDEKRPSSSEAVQMVAEGTADIAAVWDDTVKTNRPKYPNVRFVKIDETPLPNDLLVCSKDLPDPVKRALKAAVATACAKRLDFGETDFSCWTPFESEDVETAREALASLRRQAIPQPPVTVEILVPDNASDAARYKPYIEAAAHAIRFSGTEFTIYDRDFHGPKANLTWHIDLINPGALKLTSTIVDVPDVKPQTFNISFNDPREDLPKRIETKIHTQMNRIRHLWPYETSRLTILRDVGFSLPKGTSVVVQRITWVDPARSTSKGGGQTWTLRVDEADLRKFLLEGEFPRHPQTTEFELDPMSNVAYRVVLVRPLYESLLLRILTFVFVLLFLLSAVAVIVDYVRGSRSPGVATEDERAVQDPAAEEPGHAAAD